MKKLLLVATVIVVAFTATTCNKVTENNIQGTWEYAGQHNRYVEQVPNSSKDIDWDWVCSAPDIKESDRFVLIFYNNGTCRMGGVDGRLGDYSIKGDILVVQGQSYYAKFKEKDLFMVAYSVLANSKIAEDASRCIRLSK
ncbi:MAG: hypothetical protein LBQ31_03475 [Bacteroidales bacterium]|jgi:hypothetical protein|nr:hypothetical protein [Bacteroidales bacterium]